MRTFLYRHCLRLAAQGILPRSVQDQEDEDGGAPNRPSTPTGAVFLSYASQDTDAAQRICDTLRAASIEVWFDKNALREAIRGIG